MFLLQPAYPVVSLLVSVVGFFFLWWLPLWCE